MGRTGEYGPLNWPITAAALTKRYNNYSYVCLYSPLYCCRINLLKQMSHNNVIMICIFGFVIWFVPSESDIGVFSFIDRLKRKATVLHLYPLTSARRLLLARQAMREIFFMNYMPFSFIKPFSTITLFGGGSRKFRKKRPSSPLSPSNENFTSTWLCNYNNTRKPARRVGVVQKRFENSRKKEEPRPPRPLP